MKECGGEVLKKSVVEKCCGEECWRFTFAFRFVGYC